MRRIVFGLMLTALLLVTFTFAFMMQLAIADETTHVKADGSTCPLTASISTIDNIANTFTSNRDGRIDAKKVSIFSRLSSMPLEQLPSLVTGNAVANVTSFETIRWQEKTFYAAGRYWLFYIDGDYPSGSALPNSTVYYTTSTDGVSWASPTLLASGLDENAGENVEAFLSNNGYLQAFYRSNNELWYRMGTPESDGSISWVTPGWQLVFDANAGAGESSGTCDFYAMTDSNNYPWVSWGYVQELGRMVNPTDTKMYVWKDAFNDGTWQTALGFPHNVGTGNYTNDLMVPLSNGQVYVMYFLDNPPLTGQIYGELWNGTAWGPQETCTTSQVYQQYQWGCESWDRTAVADSNNDIYLAFLSASLNLVFVERTVGGGWSSETIVQSNCGSYSSPSFNVYNGNARLFWINDSATICYKNYVGGVWDSDPTLIVNETNSEIAVGACPYGTDDGRLNAFTMTLGSSIGLLWVNNQTATNTGQIMFGLFQPPTAPVHSNISFSGAAANSLCTFSCYWTDVVGLSTFIFSTNNTGHWQNDSVLSFSGTASWANVTKTLNSTVGTVVGYEWFANDTSGNWATTGIQTLTTRALFHDVAVTNVASSKTVVGQGYSLNASVTVGNPGDYPETFNTTLYANTTAIGNITVTNLPSETFASIAFSWNSTGLALGNYTLSAYAWPVPGETNTANNNCTGGWVIVSIPGDATGPNGWPDFKVDMRDIGAVARLFGVSYQDPQYDPNYDINGDGKIDMKDIGIAARNFGKHYP